MIDLFKTRSLVKYLKRFKIDIKMPKLLFLGIFMSIFLFSECKKKQSKAQSIVPDSTLYTVTNYSSLVLDSTDISTFLKKSSISDSLKNEVNQFYARRNSQFAWFNQNGLTCAMPTFYTRLQNYRLDFDDNSLDNVQLDSLVAKVNADEKNFLKEKKRIVQLELLLTTTFFKYAQKVYGGTTKKSFDLEWFIPRKKKNYQILLDSLVSSAVCEKVPEPVNQYYIHLKEKLSQYRIIQKNGGFPTIITEKKELSMGDSDSCLIKVKQYLWLAGDLKINDKSTVFNDTLLQAVKVFQGRMGLVENGKINKKTIAELNKPIDFRIQQIMVNLERLRWIPVEMEDNYLLINIPEYRLHVFESGKQVWKTNVVVGQTARQTSIFKGNLSQIILNPYWGVPMSIGKNEILPHIKRNPNYLERNNIEVLSGEKVVNPNGINWSKYKTSLPYTFRQKPGKNNALGKMKFLFPNNYHIYLHDTPSKSLFKEANRAFSHGCIRVENPKKLVLYLLRNEKDWNEAKVDKILTTDQEVGIRVRPTVSVYIAYFTAWVDNTGQLNFRNDLYNLDDRLSKEVFGE